jgi:cell volume regulation protein A
MAAYMATGNPTAENIETSNYIFNIVFFTVLLSMLIQGTTIGILADKLGLAESNKQLKNDNGAGG